MATLKRMVESSEQRRLARVNEVLMKPEMKRALRRKKHLYVSRLVAAKCIACGQRFRWLPPNFDMKHRFDSRSHEYCGGEIMEVVTCEMM